MRHRFIFPALLVFLILQIGFPSSLVDRKINRVLASPMLRHARIGIYAQIVGTRKIIYSHHAFTPMIPASNLKLLTTSCALLKLGEGYRFVTTFQGGPIQNGRLLGNLVIKGGGDPTWNTDFYPSATAPLESAAQKLRDEGIRVIDGDLIVDDSLFDRRYTGSGWKSRYQWDDYAAEVGALSLNRNSVEVSVFPGHDGGSPLQIRMSPPNQVLHIINRAWTSTGSSRLFLSRNRSKNLAVLSGPINDRSRGISFEFNVNDPPLFTGSAFEEILKAHGIKLMGHVRLIRSFEIGKLPPEPVLAQIESPPLIDIIHLLNKESDNFLAEHVFRELGAVVLGKGSAPLGERAVALTLVRLGIKHPHFTMVDGSGLSVMDRVPPHLLVEVLQAMATKPAGIAWRNTFPAAGIDGTLEDRLSGLGVQAKTGALEGVNSLSGYLVTRAGQTMVFSIILNHFSFSSETARGIIDHLVRILAQTPYASN